MGAANVRIFVMLVCCQRFCCRRGCRTQICESQPGGTQVRIRSLLVAVMNWIKHLPDAMPLSGRMLSIVLCDVKKCSFASWCCSVLYVCSPVRTTCGHTSLKHMFVILKIVGHGAIAIQNDVKTNWSHSTRVARVYSPVSKIVAPSGFDTCTREMAPHA